MRNKQTRRVKLYGKYRPLKTSWEGKVVPWLNVSGIWLERAGFKTGDQVEITIDNHRLIIKHRGGHGTH
jgi:toxic protein SymE